MKNEETNIGDAFQAPGERPPSPKSQGEDLNPQGEDLLRALRLWKDEWVDGSRVLRIVTNSNQHPPRINFLAAR
jgi:hypothetical protein